MDNQQPRGPGRTTVFYDGGCPLCRREIEHYQRRDRSGELAWVDITQDRLSLDAHGLSPGIAMARLHVLDGQGRWQIGAWGFAAIWERLPGYRWLARLVRGLHLIPLIDAAYRPFARWRLSRRCSGGTCDAG
jgi:predicted DCC family thiol-disulfide oxidoreductase YuxK